MRLFALLVALAMLPLAGAQEAKHLDLASVVSKADAEATLGQPVKDPQLRNGDGVDGYYSRCNYYSEPGGKSLVIRLRQGAGGTLDAKKEFALIGADCGKLRALSGLGDKAAITPAALASDSTRSFMLYVAKGNALVTIGIGGIDDENVATEKAKALAKKIVARL